MSAGRLVSTAPSVSIAPLPPRPGRLRRLLALADAERGSLPMVMLVVLIGMALGAVLVPVIVTQARSSVFLSTRQDSLAAAQSGVDLLVGRIRAAAAAGQGTASRIPCADPSGASGPKTPEITGGVDDPSPATYRISVQYFVQDPVATPGQSPMLCAPGKGPYNPADKTVVPGYARITATGSDGAGPGRTAGRTLVSTYSFQTTNRVNPGGQISISPASAGSTRMCMDAGASPTAGSPVVLQACTPGTTPSAQQVLAYRSDLTLQLVSSTAGLDTGLCIAPQGSAPGGGAPTDGLPAVLLACGQLGTPYPREQWSYVSSGAFQAPEGATTDYDGSCLTVADQNAGTAVKLGSCNVDGGATSGKHSSWIPDPNVGAGGATDPQQVNFEQFGRCLDVDSEAVWLDHVIVYPCKQNPDRSKIGWNELFTFDPATGWLYVTNKRSDNYGDNRKYCLSSLRSEGGKVRMTRCDSPGTIISGYDSTSNTVTYTTLPGYTAASLVWTRRDGSASLPYTDRYTYRDSSTDATRCLDITAPPGGGGPWSYGVTQTCNGTKSQKWNAEPNVSTAAINDITELPAAAPTPAP